MSIILTNGLYYITTSRSGKVVKTPALEEAQTFYNVNTAMRKIFSAPGKCKGYYPYETEEDTCRYSAKKYKERRKYSKEERKILYDRAGGRCALCGKRLALENMTLDHITPLSMDGTDDMNNLQIVCFACNQFKGNILPEEFIEKVIKIFMYQTERNCGENTKWQIVHNILEMV